MPRASNGSPLRRKIQRLGASSLIVTLPKDWAKRHKVRVGDAVSIYDEGDKLVIIPDGVPLETNLYFSLNHIGVERHAGRILLCAYSFGFDKVTFYSSKNIKQEFEERMHRTIEKLPETEVWKTSPKMMSVDLGTKEGRLEDLLVTYGRSVSRVLSRLSGLLQGRVNLTREDLEREHAALERLSFKLLRVANSSKAVGDVEERQNRYLIAAANLVGLVAESIYKFGLDLIDMVEMMSDEERERLSFILQVLEVALSTVILSLEPPSVKKAEESYEKVSEILGLEGGIADVVRDASPAFAYLLARTIDIARVIEIAENIMLCNALISKYGEREPKNGNGYDIYT